MNEEIARALANLIIYSGEDIQFDYKKLTPREQRAVGHSGHTYAELVHWAMRHGDTRANPEPRSKMHALRDLLDFYTMDTGISPCQDIIRSLEAAVAAEADDEDVPTMTECELLVMGGDDGEVPADLRKLFPHINTALEEVMS